MRCPGPGEDAIPRHHGIMSRNHFCFLSPYIKGASGGGGGGGGPIHLIFVKEVGLSSPRPPPPAVQVIFVFKIIQTEHNV